MNENKPYENVSLRELSQMRNFQREIRLDTDRLNRLDVTLYPSVRLNAERAALAPYAAEIRQIIQTKRENCLRERLRLERYIASVDDSLVRMAMTLRFLDGLHWQAVAMRIGGGNTEDSVKKMVYRYIEKQKTEQKKSAP